MKFPTEVPVDEEKLAKLTTTYKEAYKSIVEEITTATDWGVSNRKQILKQIEGILKDLGVEVDAYLKDELPAQYKDGADAAIAQLKSLGAPIPVKSGFNNIHQQAIQQLLDDTSKAFAESLTGVARSARLLIGKATRQMITQKLAEGNIGGKALRDIRNSIKATLQEQGLDALIDKGGHKWTLDRYAEMLIRTKSAETRNRGLGNRMVENGYDLVQVSSHGTTCELCGPWEGVVLSMTGETAGYPTVADAEADGLFHPNCKHAINALVPDLASQTYAYDPDTETYVVDEDLQKQLADEYYN